jgi:hypothetical protein
LSTGGFVGRGVDGDGDDGVLPAGAAGFGAAGGATAKANEVATERPIPFEAPKASVWAPGASAMAGRPVQTPPLPVSGRSTPSMVALTDSTPLCGSVAAMAIVGWAAVSPASVALVSETDGSEVSVSSVPRVMLVTAPEPSTAWAVMACAPSPSRALSRHAVVDQLSTPGISIEVRAAVFVARTRPSTSTETVVTPDPLSAAMNGMQTLPSCQRPSPIGELPVPIAERLGGVGSCSVSVACCRENASSAELVTVPAVTALVAWKTTPSLA